mgnify:CR=1 FL=1
MHLRSKVSYRLKKLLHNKKKVSLIGFTFVLLVMLYLFSDQSHPSSNKTNYTIGIDANWRGVELFGKEKNFSAFSHDLLLAIAKEEKVTFNVVTIESYEKEKLIDDQLIDGALTGLFPSIIEQRNYLFSKNIYPLGPVLTLPAKNFLLKWQEIAGKPVGVYAFSPIVLKLQKTYDFQMRLYEDIKRALADLNIGKIDGVIFPVLPSLTYTSTFYSHHLKVVTYPLDKEGIHLMTYHHLKGSTLIKMFNQGLQKVKEKGIYQKILESWNLTDTEMIIDPIEIKP